MQESGYESSLEREGPMQMPNSIVVTNILCYLVDQDGPSLLLPIFNILKIKISAGHSGARL